MRKSNDHVDAVYAITLPGPGLGDVAVRDVVEFLREVVELVSHSAAVEVARPIGGVGRRGAAIERASNVRLLGLRNGSLVAEFAAAPAPPTPDSLGLDAQALSELAVQAIFDLVEGSDRRPELAPAVIDFAKRMDTRRPGQPVVFIDRRQSAERVTPLNEAVLRRIRGMAGQSSAAGPHEEQVVGRLFEANVDADTARLRTLVGESVTVSYEPRMEAEIKRLLGDRASLRGDVTYDPATNHVRSIHAREVFAGDQLQFDGVDFWRDPTFAELAEAVGARPVENPDDLHFEATDAEWDQLYEVLGEHA